MRIKTLNDRIQNAKLKIEKKENTISKKQVLIEKKETQIRKLGFEPSADKYEVSKVSNDGYWILCDIGYLQEDIKRGSREIEEAKVSLKKYEQQLTGEIEREAILLKDIPESMKLLQVNLVDKWDAWDIERRNKIKADQAALGYKEFQKKYKCTNLQCIYETDEQIHSSNVQDAKMLILDLYYRVKDITGEITDWSDVRAAQGACGMTVLNGCVIGKEGRCEIESILAGGYNIQRLHIRVLVKEYQ